MKVLIALEMIASEDGLDWRRDSSKISITNSLGRLSSGGVRAATRERARSLRGGVTVVYVRTDMVV